MARQPCSLYMRYPHSHRRAGSLGALGTRRSASSDGSYQSEGPTRPTRPMRPRRRSRIALRIAVKILLAVVLVVAAAIGLLFALTPSAGQATALVIRTAGDQVPDFSGSSCSLSGASSPSRNTQRR